jgi:DNA-binding MarR family transcriptional regulator
MAAPALQQQALDTLFTLFAALRGEMRASFNDSPPGLAPMHMRVLKHCLHHAGTSQQALVRASGRDKGQIARLVKDLDEQGLLQRQPDPADGRSQLLTPTPAGRAACQQFRQQEAAVARRLFESMSPADVQSFIDQLAALRQRLGPPG